jgi:hypothetical protein
VSLRLRKRFEVDAVKRAKVIKEKKVQSVNLDDEVDWFLAIDCCLA